MNREELREVLVERLAQLDPDWQETCEVFPRTAELTRDFLGRCVDALGILDAAEALKAFDEAAEVLDDEADNVELWEHPAAMQIHAGDLRNAGGERG